MQLFIVTIRSLKSLAIGITALVAISGHVLAQEKPQVPICNPEYAKMIVDQQAGELNLNVETLKKIRIWILYADFLWDKDRAAAKKYFLDALKLAQESKAEPRKISSSPAPVSSYEADLEMIVISAIGRRDPRWAQNLYKKLIELSDDNLSNFEKEIRNSDRAIRFLQIAANSAATDPNLSLEMFRYAMANLEIDSKWIYPLFDVAKRDYQLANRVFLELIRKNVNAKPSRLLGVSHYALGLPNGIGVLPVQYNIAIPEQFVVEPAIKNEYLRILVSSIEAFLSSPRDDGKPDNSSSEFIAIFSALEDLDSLGGSIPIDLQPRIAVAKVRARALLTEKDTESIKNNRSRFFARSISQRLAELEEMDSKGKLTDVDIVRSLYGATGDIKEMVKLQSWVEKISSAEMKRSALVYFYYLLSDAAQRADLLDDAERFATKISDSTVRAAVLFTIAKKRLDNLNSISDAYQILAKVSSEARRSEDSAQKGAVLIGLANAYSRLNSSFAFSELGDAVKVLNKTGPHSEVPGSIYIRISGGRNYFTMVLSPPEFSFAGTFEKMSGVDTGLALSNAKALDDPYLRAVAVIAVMKPCSAVQ